MKPRPADVIVYLVTPKSAWSSKLIAIGELILGRDRGVKEASHWALWTSPGRQIEAVWPKVRRSAIYENRKYEIWRRVGITAKQRKMILRSAGKRIGQHYGLIYVLTGGLIHPNKEPVCCSIVQDVYADAGLSVKGQEPDDIYSDRKMRLIYKNYGA